MGAYQRPENENILYNIFIVSLFKKVAKSLAHYLYEVTEVRDFRFDDQDLRHRLL